MFRNYIITAWRNLRRDRLYSIINITGLSVGIACCIFIFLFIQRELSYDRYHKNARRIYRVTEVLHLPKEDNARAVTSPPMAPLLQSSFPEIEKAVRINYSSRQLSREKIKLNDTRIIYADNGFFDIFSYSSLSGNLQQALNEPYSLVLTKSTAKKYFNEQDPVGKTMMLSDTIPLTVKAVMDDVPEQSHFSFDAVLSGSTMSQMTQSDLSKAWYYNNFYTYLLLAEHSDPASLEKKISSRILDEMAAEKKESGLWYDLKLQPLTDIHLKSTLNSEINPNGDMMYIYIFSIAAILILLIACCNFINLSTAKSVNRAKEIGLRKVIGARKEELTAQFLGESLMLAIISAILSLIIVVALLPYYNVFTHQSFPVSVLFTPTMMLVYTGIILSVGLIAGTYPAFMMSSFKPVRILKGQLKYEWRDILLRKGLVVFQFTIAIILIAGTGLIFQQLKYLREKKLGLNKEQVLEFNLSRDDIPKKELLLKEIRKTSGVLQASITDFTFSNEINTIAVLPQGFAENEVSSHCVISVDENFLQTFDIALAAGRNFSKDFPTDQTSAFIVNETAVKQFGWKSNALAIGKDMDWGLGKKGKVIGVVKDFNFKSLHENIKPLILHIEPDFYGVIAVKVKPEEVQQTISGIKDSWKNVSGQVPQDYTFMDEDFASLYKTEMRMQSIMAVFTVLSIFVACLGLFGLTAFTIKQRFREIGIRKVLGATISNVLALLSKDLIRLVCISILIAIPVAWISVNHWLSDFAYHINISLWNFVISGLLALTVACITIGLQSLKAAVESPARSIRTE